MGIVVALTIGYMSYNYCLALLVTGRIGNFCQLLTAQDAQGENLCQYREFEPSDVVDSDTDDADWQAQKKGCCAVM